MSKSTPASQGAPSGSAAAQEEIGTLEGRRAKQSCLPRSQDGREGAIQLPGREAELTQKPHVTVDWLLPQTLLASIAWLVCPLRLSSSSLPHPRAWRSVNPIDI
jgi:hypothetical protein